MNAEHQGVLKDLSPEERTATVERGFPDKVRKAGGQLPFVRDAIAA